MSKSSKRECRVYVGNLSYDVKYRDLMEFMRGGGFGRVFCHLETEMLWGEEEEGTFIFWLRFSLPSSISFILERGTLLLMEGFA